MAQIAEMRAILGDESRVYALIKEELAAVKDRYDNRAARRSCLARARSTSSR